MSVLDIILISLGALAVVIYTTLKVLQLIKFKHLVKQSIKEGLSELDAREKAANIVYHRSKNKKPNDVNSNDTIYDE